MCRKTFCVVFVSLALGVTSGSAATVAFSDSFSPTASSLWNNYSGNWTASGGTYLGQVPNNSPLTFTGLPYSLTDFTVSVTVNNLGDGGMWLRSDDTNKNGILLVTGGLGYGQGTRGGSAGNSLYWHVVQNGAVSTPLNAVSGVFTPGNTYTIQVTVTGNTYSAYIGGSTTPATTLVNNVFASGYVGLYDDQPNTATGSGFGAAQSFSNFSLSGTLAGGAAVPEPGTAFLLLTGLVGIVFGLKARR